MLGAPADPEVPAASPLAQRLAAWGGRHGWVDPILLGILAAVVSSVGYWRPSIWTDEAATITAATRSLPELWAMIHNVDAVHFAYYLTMHFWIDAFGTSAASIRFPSIVAVGFAAAGTVVLTRELTTRRTALWAGVLFALLPRVTWSGTEARSSAMTAAIAVWLAVLLLGATRHHGWTWWVLYGVGVWLSVTFYLYLGFVVAAHGVTLAWQHRRRLGHVVPWLAAVVPAVLATSWLVLLAREGEGAVNPGRPGLRTVPDVLVRQWFLGAPPTRQQTFPLRDLPLWAWSAVAVAAIGWAILVWVVVARRDRVVRHRGAPVGVLALALPWIAVPTATLLAYSALAKPVYNPRYLEIAAPAVALLLGVGMASLRLRWTQWLVVAVIAVVSVPGFVAQRGTYAKKDTDWVTVASIMRDRAVPGDVVVYGLRSGSVKLTTRRISVAYPEAFTGLQDITLHRTGAQDATLWGTSYRLPAVIDQVAGAPRVFLLQDWFARTPHVFARQYLQDLAAVGYRPVWVWRGPSTRVWELAPSG